MFKKLRLFIGDCLRKIEEIIDPENPSLKEIEEFRAYMNLIPTNEKQSIEVVDTIDKFHYYYPKTFHKIVEEFQ